MHFSIHDFNFLVAVVAAILLTINFKLRFVAPDRVKGYFDPQWQLSQRLELKQMGQFLEQKASKGARGT